LIGDEWRILILRKHGFDAGRSGIRKKPGCPGFSVPWQLRCGIRDRGTEKAEKIFLPIMSPLPYIINMTE